MKEITEIHVSFGDYSTRYRVGNKLPSVGWGEITKIVINDYETMQHDKLTYDIYANKHDGLDSKEGVAKRIINLPVELTYK